MKQTQSVRELEIGRDYVNPRSNIIVIDRHEDCENRGFHGKIYYNNLPCHNPTNWREATESEVIEAFKKHLIHRYGEDWETMKIKEQHPDRLYDINTGIWDVDIYKECDGWSVRNVNGLLYCNGIWVERLEEVEEPKIHIKEAIKENTVIHCETEEEAKRILGIEDEKPLFVTEDGVQMFDRDEYITIGSDYNKIYMTAYNCDAPYSSDVKRFLHESNADEYIWKNKPVFSYNEIWKYAPYDSPLSIFEQLAKERSKE